MKLLIAGSRTITEYLDVAGLINQAVRLLHSGTTDFRITHVVSGGAIGVDRLGERWAGSVGVDIIQMKPDWSKGKAAGLARNTDLVNECNAAVIIWDGKSRGTLDTTKKVLKAGKPLWFFTINMFRPDPQLELIKSNLI